MKLFILFIISFNLYASYIPESEVGNNFLGEKFVSKSKCIEFYGEDCLKIKGMPWEYLEVKAEEITEEMNDTCIPLVDCDSKYSALNCNKDFRPKKGSISVYCEKVIPKRIGINQVKKATHDAAELVIQNEKDDDNQKRNQLRGLLNSLRSGTDLTPQQTRRLQIQVIKKLFGG